MKKSAGLVLLTCTAVVFCSDLVSVPKHTIQLGVATTQMGPDNGHTFDFSIPISYDYSIRRGILSVGLGIEPQFERVLDHEDAAGLADLHGLGVYPRIGFHPIALWKVSEERLQAFDPYLLFLAPGFGTTSYDSEYLTKIGAKAGVRWHSAKTPLGAWAEWGTNNQDFGGNYRLSMGMVFSFNGKAA